MDYKKYKWFFTSNDLLVVGGKSAEQNDSLLKELGEGKKDLIVMHTSAPGSPFCAIVSDIDKVKKRDIDECATFTGCFSQAWKQGKKACEIGIFRLSQLGKPRSAKTGTWQVAGKSEKANVKLELALTKQKGVWRAVPRGVADKKAVKVYPGKIDKTKMVDEIMTLIGEKNKHDEILAALPAGGVRIV